VFLAYATAHEYAVENRETGLPRGEVGNAAWRATAVLEHVGFATKVTLDRRILTRAVDARLPAT
jgi:hypothetical protein